jgi:hypothetical protein
VPGQRTEVARVAEPVLIGVAELPNCGIASCGGSALVTAGQL